MQPKEPALRGTHVLSCVWDFDKTLCPGYMQTPLFRAYGVDEERFWKETNQLPALYARKGIRTSKDSVYLNHLLSYVKSGPLKGLTNRRLRELGAEIPLCPGLPDFFPALKEHVRELGRRHNLEVVLEQRHVGQRWTSPKPSRAVAGELVEQDVDELRIRRAASRDDPEAHAADSKNQRYDDHRAHGRERRRPGRVPCCELAK